MLNTFKGSGPPVGGGVGVWQSDVDMFYRHIWLARDLQKTSSTNLQHNHLLDAEEKTKEKNYGKCLVFFLILSNQDSVAFLFEFL